MSKKSEQSLDSILDSLSPEDRQWLEAELLIYSNAWLYREDEDQPYRVLSSKRMLEIQKEELEKVKRAEYRAQGLCEECGENPCHIYCKLQTYRAKKVVPQINPVYPSAEVIRAFGVCSNCGTQLIGNWCHGCGREWDAER